MKLSVIILPGLLGSCMAPIEVHSPPATIPADLLQVEPGYEGRVPETERDWALAAVAEKEGRVRANAKINGIRGIVEATTKED